ncbi:hypothetical protein XENOCAPTIV_026581, partial [Xenoophorus captivus]
INVPVGCETSGSVSMLQELKPLTFDPETNLFLHQDVSLLAGDTAGQMFLSDVKPAVLFPCCRNLNADDSLLIRLSVLNPNPFLQQWKWSRVKGSSCFFSPTKTSIDQISVCHEK